MFEEYLHQLAMCHNSLQVYPLYAARRALWELLFSDYFQFGDFRDYKAITGSVGPDYRHIASGEGLWYEYVTLTVILLKQGPIICSCISATCDFAQTLKVLIEDDAT